ncbi:hypothetical protein HU830_04705 [Lactobacillus sp. DCY120]|uniref:Uncharacterized protein n=1 Tax=Bombilactobacillus apium TaxID=2675299 RepID=A0A850R2A0_9LACO|nr:hypothetical protein [Bombilactobacillus apium]NVY96470.1 hypothetical protein [Bombilactobacillus apium]
MINWLVILDLLFLLILGFNLYWQAQIIVVAKYKYSSLILTIFFALWFWEVPQKSWTYVILVAAFLTVTLMQGSGGIGKSRLVTRGLFTSTISYAQLTHVTLIPVQIPTVKPQVVTVFTTLKQRNVQLTFNRSFEEVQTELRKLLPEKVKIEIASL